MEQPTHGEESACAYVSVWWSSWQRLQRISRGRGGWHRAWARLLLVPGMKACQCSVVLGRAMEEESLAIFIAETSRLFSSAPFILFLFFLAVTVKKKAPCCYPKSRAMFKLMLIVFFLCSWYFFETLSILRAKKNQQAFSSSLFFSLWASSFSGKKWINKIKRHYVVTKEAIQYSNRLI